MGIDGFSIANLGLNLNKTTSGMASDAEVLARHGNENQIKSVDGLSKKQKTLKKDKDAGFNGGVFLPGMPDEDNIKSSDSTASDGSDIKEDDFSNFHFRLNSDHMIEIFDAGTNNIVRVISPEDAAKVLMNLSETPSIIVNERA